MVLGLYNQYGGWADVLVQEASAAQSYVLESQNGDLM